MENARAVRGKPEMAGFTLLEVLVALFIFAVGMLAVASMQGESIKGNTFSDLMTVATTLAEAKMEELMGFASTNPSLQDNNPANNGNLLRATNTGSMTGANDWDGHSETNLDRNGASVASGMFTRIWNVANNHPATGLMTILVVVQWADQRGNHQVYASCIR